MQAPGETRMSRVHFQAGEVDLELTGSEAFVVRQLRLLSELLGGVDAGALGGAGRSPEPSPDPAPEPVYSRPEPRPTNGGPATGQALSPAAGAGAGGKVEEPTDALVRFFRSVPAAGQDRQADAALLFAYYLQRKEGMRSLQLSDLIRCCIRAGVDTRNFNRTLGTLTRRGFLETVRHGHAYRLSEQGAAAVENRM